MKRQREKKEALAETARHRKDLQQTLSQHDGFDVAVEDTPKHQRSHPVYLGRGVSEEASGREKGMLCEARVFCRSRPLAA